MKTIRFKYVFLLLFTLLFVNLLSINVSKIKAEEESLDLSNAYRGEINDYWVLVNYGENYIGQDTVTIFLDPSAIDNSDVSYIQINEFNEYGEIVTKYFKRGVDSSFASRFTYSFVTSGYGEKNLTIFLLEDLLNKPTSIIDRIDISGIERVRTIEHLTSANFAVYGEVSEMTSTPYKVYVDIKENSCDYMLKNVNYSYIHVDSDGSETLVTGSAILDESDANICNRYYFMVSENATYNITIEDYFGYVKPDEDETISITINNFYDDVLNIVANYDNSLTNQDVYVYVSIFDGTGKEYNNSSITSLTYEYDGIVTDIKNLGLFVAKENGIYIVRCKNSSNVEVTLEVNITNIDRVAPVVYVNDYLHINTSDVEKSPYIFDPFSYVLATDNASLGDNLTISATYYYVSEADYTCKTYQGNVIEYNIYRYLYGANDVCVEYEVKDEAGNSRSAITRIIVSDNTKPTVTYTVSEVILQIGDDMPSNEELINKFGLVVDDNSRLFDSSREITITSDLSNVNLEELNRYAVYISAIDASNNESDVITLTVIVTERILVIDAVANQYIVYGEEMKEIEYTCNDNPCSEEILPADWDKLSGELYISSGAKYSGTYTIYSSLNINSRKYSIQLGNLGVFTIKQRTFKIIANSYTIDYKDDEPILTWYMDTSVCNDDLSTKYTSYELTNYSCTFVSGDDFGGGSYVYSNENNRLLYAGGIVREEGNTVKYDGARNVIYYRITLGNLKVLEQSNGGRTNYYLDFYGLYINELSSNDGNTIFYNTNTLDVYYKLADDEGNLVDYSRNLASGAIDINSGYARFYILPKHVEVTFTNVTKIYGENDPNTTYIDENLNLLREDNKSNIQYEFTCWSMKYPINVLTTAQCQQEIQLTINREDGENVGSYKIIGIYGNSNYEVQFNEEHDSGALASAYLNIVKRSIEMKVDGTNGDGKYSIFYEDALPLVTVTITSDPDLTYTGLANNSYLNINDNSIISFVDRLSYGTHRVKYLDSSNKVMETVIGGYNEYVTGVGTYTITRDTITILNNSNDDVLSNYNLTFIDGTLEVFARQIYIKVIDGLTKTYGDSDPTFTSSDIVSKYGDDTNYLIDGSGNYILQIINTLNNTSIVDSDHYEPFDKEKLKYYLTRSNLRRGLTTVDVHDGEMVGEYLISCDYFENDTNYIIDIYQDYYFTITTRQVALTINSNTIEFNYNNLVPKFSYSYSNIAFTDTLIGQPSVGSFSGSYRNNGTYVVRMGDIISLSSKPSITSSDNMWYINGEITNVSLDDYKGLDISLIKIINGNYYLIDLDNNTTINTGVAVKETDVTYNYTFSVNIGFLEVTPRNVIIVPSDGISKEYGDGDKILTYYVKHYVEGLDEDEYQIEAILDESDFSGYLSREVGEKPGIYYILQNTLAPSTKGASSNFTITGFESNHYFEITRRTLVIKHAASDSSNNISVFYGDSSLDSMVSGYTTIQGKEALDLNLCTIEVIDGVETCDAIYDKIEGSITTDPENPSDVGVYTIKNKDLHLVRVISGVDVSDYYDLVFIEATLTILPRIIYITPSEGQSKIYGENDGGSGCGITYTYYPTLVKASDTFSGCLKRESKILSDGRETSEDVGEYKITLGDLVIGPNYTLVLNGSVMYQIKLRNITITAKVEGENVVKSSNMNVYTMTYGDEYTLGYDIGGLGLAYNPSLAIADEIVNNVRLSPSYNGVGAYLVIQGSLVITNSRNYSLTFEKAQFNVNKRKVIIEPTSITKIYGDSDPSTIPFTIQGNPISYTGTLSRLQGENVGKYRITQGTLSFGDNYDVEIVETYLEIVERKVEVIAKDQSKIYGDSDPELEYDVVVENDFVLDTPFLGTLSRTGNEEVGTYSILQNTLSLNSNYQINYTPGTFTIYYIGVTSITITNQTNNKYQNYNEESEVRLFASFNLGANPSYLKDITWTIVKNNTIEVSYTKDLNNIVSFTPSGTRGTYLITASYNGISATYEVIVSENVDLSITIRPITTNVTQTLGLESEVTYSAEVQLNSIDITGLVIEWYASDTLVCSNSLSSTINYCSFTPNLEIGVHKVYAKINNKTSNELELTIKDNAAPVITLTNQGEIYYIEAFQNATENSIKYNEPGYEAIDDVDGNVKNKVVIKGIEDINYYKVGTYYIIYEVSDSHGHVANNYRTVIVQDTVAPTVTLNNPELSEIVLEYGDRYVEYGATATDAYDNSYGKELTVYIDSNLNINKVGTYEIIYFAIDSNGLRGQTTRTVRIQDSVKPIITLIGEETIYIEYKDSFKDPGAWFNDNYDGRFMIYANSIVFTAEGSEESIEVSSVDTTLLGRYRLSYYQEDSSGNAPEEIVIRTVIVRDSTPPVITLSGSNPYILRYGSEYVEPGFKVIDNYDGDITDRDDLVTVVEIIGNTLGTYYVYYSAKDSHNNIASEVKREVIILDLVSPIIYFTESCPQYITIEALYEEYDLRCNYPAYGYTVVDDYLPDLDAIQNWVVVTGSVDNTTIGTYQIKYDVSDASGNKAVTLIRYVDVVDTTPPEISLKPNEEGEIDFYVEVFGEYIEPGWITSDLYDDTHNLEITVTTTNNININKLNTYTVTYIAIDSSGNQSEPIYREITVRDTVAPVVTLIGDSELTLERGTPYAEYGASAIDNYDGRISQIIITGAPTGMNLGDFNVNYCAIDSSNNEGCTIRVVHVVDTIPPVVLGVEDGAYYRAPLYIYYSPLTGTDEILTGTLNGQLISSPWYVYQEGSYHLIVRDDAGNETVVDFVIDTTAPNLYGASNGEYINHAVTIYSDELLSSITYRFGNGGYVSSLDQSIYFENEGQYWVYATDMAGNVSEMITFIIDTTPPAYRLDGVLNGGITNTDVTLVTENDVIVSVNNEYIPTSYTFTENGYYKVTIRDLAGNDVFIQFVINKNADVVINNKTVTFISQNNAIGKFTAKANASYPKSSGFIYAKPLLDGTFEYISGKLFSDEEYSKLINGEDVEFDVPSVDDDEMVVAFIVTLDELNKFTTQTVEGDDDSAIAYALVAVGVAGLIGGFFYFFVFVKRKREDEEEEDEEIVDDDIYY